MVSLPFKKKIGYSAVYIQEDFGEDFGKGFGDPWGLVVACLLHVVVACCITIDAWLSARAAMVG